MTNDLVFRARIDLLRRNLAVVQDVLVLVADLFPRHQAAISPDVQRRLDDLRAKLRTVEDGIDRVANDDTMGALQEARTQVRNVYNILFPMSAPSDEQTVLPAEHDLKEDLVDKAERCTNSLDALTARLEARTDPRYELEAKIEKEPWAKLWTDYRKIELACWKLFSEYVDLVRGLALRSSGLDDDIFRIADKLVRIVSRKWRSITIPSRMERMAPTSGRIIRIGFPEWTVWTVPMAIHEYGHVFTEVVPELYQLLGDETEETKDERAAIESLLADAFAALTVGPAYACAALLTRLDPSAPGRGGPEGRHVVHRAAMIMAGLEAGGPPPEAQGMIERLRTEWVAAVKDTGYDGLPLEPHPRTDELVGAVHHECLGLRLPYDRWFDFVVPTSNDLLAAAQAGAAPATAPQKGDVDLRHLLNAAWLCRVPPSNQAGRVATHPDQLGRIARQVSDIGLNWLHQPSTPDERQRPSEGASGRSPNERRQG